MKKRYLSIFVVLFAVSALVAFQGCSRVNTYGSLEGSVPTISVQGLGKVTIKPDEAIIRFGVQTEEKYLEKAYKKNTERTNAVIETVKALGIKDEDIKTSSYNITPIYQRDEKGYQVPGKPASFRVSQSLQVKMRDLPKVGEIIDKVVSSGTNTFSGINFTLSNIEEVQEEAKVKAVKDAREKALILTKNLGVKTGRILRVNTSSPQPYQRAMMANEAMLARSNAPSIQPGSMEVTANCSIIYEIIQ